MNKNLFLCFLFILTFVLINAKAQQGRRPNIVYIMSDDYAAEDIAQIETVIQ